MWPLARTQFGVIGIGLGLWQAGCDERPAAPTQPIAFDHRVHAGEYQIGCAMCHPYAEHSPVAGVPSMASCYGCHRFASSDKPAIKRVVELYLDGGPIDWVRVDRLPDHVRFTHQRHVLAGVACQFCHGEVERMDVTRGLPRQDMGWCVDCHRNRRASDDCLVCHK